MFSNLNKLVSMGIVTSALLSSQLLADFHVMVNNEQKGPFSVETMKEMKASGSVSSNSLVWQDGMATWGKAGEQKDLETLFSPTPPPLPTVATMPPPPPVSTGEVKIVIDETQNDLSDANIMASMEPETLNDWKKDFEEKFDVTLGLTDDGKTFFFGEAIVKASPLDPAYGKELALTYDKAMLNLQADFILQTYGDNVVDTMSDYFENDSTNAAEFDPVELKKQAAQGKMSLIFDKFVDVVGNKIDEILEEQGIPPEEIQKRTIEQKKTLYKDNISKAMMKKAYANMSGLVPVQTKILTTTRDGKKTVRLGLIAVMSDNTLQFAKDISKGRDTLVTGKPKNIKTLLPSDDNDYLNEIGLRYVYDKKGRPMLISYGRWSVVGKTSNAARFERKVQSAKEKARMFAESYIGAFMKSNINAAQSTDVESVSEETAKKISTIENNKISDAQESRDKISETIDKSFKKIQSRSKFKLKGTGQIKTWEAKDANGILHVGSVITWSYAALENANEIIAGPKKKAKAKATGTVVVQKKRVIKNVSKTSKSVNTTDDF